MADHERDPVGAGDLALVGFALATFNVSVVLLAVLIVPRSREVFAQTIEQANTLVGFLLFAAFWAIAWMATGVALRGLSIEPPPPWWRACARGAWIGGLTGAAVFAVPLIPGLGATLAGGRLHEAFLVAAIFGTVGTAVAFAAGAFVGLLLGAVDRAVLALAELVSG